MLEIISSKSHKSWCSHKNLDLCVDALYVNYLIHAIEMAFQRFAWLAVANFHEKIYISLKKYIQTHFLCKLYNNMKMLRNLLNFVKHDIDYCVVFVSLDVFLLSLWGVNILWYLREDIYLSITQTAHGRKKFTKPLL